MVIVVVFRPSCLLTSISVSFNAQVYKIVSQNLFLGAIHHFSAAQNLRHNEWWVEGTPVQAIFNEIVFICSCLEAMVAKCFSYAYFAGLRNLIQVQ